VSTSRLQKQAKSTVAPASAPPQRAPIEVGHIDDPAEHEADRVAAGLLRTSPETALERDPTPTAVNSAPPIVQDVLAEPGRPLDAAARQFFEPRLGTDLADVRIHDDNRAAQSANAVDADAYTVGNDIAFGRGPTGDALQNDELLAHELVHVVQQRDSGRTSRRSFGGADGTRAEGPLLQRAPHSRSKRPKASAKPPVDDATATRDYTDANTYLLQFYEGVHLALELNDKVRVAAQANYENIGKLKDPPSLGFAILKSVFSSVLAAVPGGAIISAGLEMGMFANDLGKLKLELDEHPIPGYTVEDEERAGPSAELKEKAKKGSEHIKTVWEGGEKVYEAIKDTLEKQKAAAEAETEALESAGLRHERIADWAQATSRAQREEQTVTQWVQQAGAKKHLRGGMLAAVKARLGPILIIDESTLKALEKRYELELYRAKYRAAGSYVRTVYYGGGLRDSDPGEPELRVSGGLSKATRRRIAECAGVTATDDETMVKVLDISTTTERVRNPGLRQPGEL
jgi:hypothetical protein